MSPTGNLTLEFVEMTKLGNLMPYANQKGNLNVKHMGTKGEQKRATKGQQRRWQRSQEQH